MAHRNCSQLVATTVTAITAVAAIAVAAITVAVGVGVLVTVVVPVLLFRVPIWFMFSLFALRSSSTTQHPCPSFAGFIAFTRARLCKLFKMHTHAISTVLRYRAVGVAALTLSYNRSQRQSQRSREHRVQMSDKESTSAPDPCSRILIGACLSPAAGDTLTWVLLRSGCSELSPRRHTSMCLR